MKTEDIDYEIYRSYAKLHYGDRERFKKCATSAYIGMLLNPKLLSFASPTAKVKSASILGIAVWDPIPEQRYYVTQVRTDEKKGLVFTKSDYNYETIEECGFEAIPDRIHYQILCYLRMRLERELTNSNSLKSK